MSAFRFIICLSCAFSFSAAADNIRLGGGIGDANIDLKQEYTFDDPDVGKDAAAWGFYAGYAFSNNLFVEFGFEEVVDAVLFKNASDNVGLFSIDFSIGYTFNTNNGFYIEPKLGYSDWTLESKEGALFNPGPEETKEIEGRDIFGELAIGYRFAKVFGMSVSYKRMNPNFGTYDSTRLNFDFSI